MERSVFVATVAVERIAQPWRAARSALMSAQRVMITSGGSGSVNRAFSDVFHSEAVNQPGQPSGRLRRLLLLLATAPVLGACAAGGYPPVASGPYPIYFDQPTWPTGYRSYQRFAPAAAPMPAAQNSSSGRGGELLAAGGGFIAGRAMKSATTAGAGGAAGDAGTAATEAITARTMAGGAATGLEGDAITTATRTVALGAPESMTASEVLGAGGAVAGGGEAIGTGEAAGALGAGVLAAGPGEILVGAAVIGGTAYLAYQYLHAHADDHNQK